MLDSTWFKNKEFKILLRYTERRLLFYSITILRNFYIFVLCNKCVTVLHRYSLKIIKLIFNNCIKIILFMLNMTIGGLRGRVD